MRQGRRSNGMVMGGMASLPISSQERRQRTLNRERQFKDSIRHIRTMTNIGDLNRLMNYYVSDDTFNMKKIELLINCCYRQIQRIQS